MLLRQAQLALRPRPRGVHLVTDEIAAGLPVQGLDSGLCHLFLQHTSASLAINENADPSVRSDLERWLRHLAPDGWEGFAHDEEGPDDMPAHAKAVAVGCSLTIPVQGGRLALGTWQGLWLLEHRERGGSRTLVATVLGEGSSPP